MDKWCASAIGIQFALSHNILFGLFWKHFGYCGSVTPKVVAICENLILLPFESHDSTACEEATFQDMPHHLERLNSWNDYFWHKNDGEK